MDQNIMPAMIDLWFDLAAPNLQTEVLDWRPMILKSDGVIFLH